jgi:hypothetical protein
MTNLALKAAHFAAATLNNPFGIGTLSLTLIVVPIIGMHMLLVKWFPMLPTILMNHVHTNKRYDY